MGGGSGGWAVQPRNRSGGSSRPAQRRNRGVRSAGAAAQCSDVGVPVDSDGGRAAAGQKQAARRPRTAGSSRPVYPIVGNYGLWQRADINGHMRRPKLESDEAKLKQLLVHCHEGNFREVRALVAHFPYLLSLTDRYGFSALHHAELSRDEHFMEKVLQLYQDPHTRGAALLEGMRRGIPSQRRRPASAMDRRTAALAPPLAHPGDATGVGPCQARDPAFSRPVTPCHAASKVARADDEGMDVTWRNPPLPQQQHPLAVFPVLPFPMNSIDC